MTCPHCKAELEQLGEAQEGVWIPDNLYRCRECLYRKNRFSACAGGLMQVIV